MPDRVLLIGKRAAVLTRLRTALSRIGIPADIAADLAGIPNADPNADADQLAAYRVVAFGRAVRTADRERTLETLRQHNAEVVAVDGLAPVTDLLVAQIEEALQTRPAGQRRIATCAVVGDRLELDVRHRTHLAVTAHTLSRLYRSKPHELLDESVAAGPLSLPLPETTTRVRRAFLVVRADRGDVRVLPVRPAVEPTVTN